eukprot:g9573.t1
MTAQPDGSGWSLHLFPEICREDPARAAVLDATLYHTRACVDPPVASTRCTFPPGEGDSASSAVCLSIPPEAVQLWSPQRPHLYGLKLSLRAAGDDEQEVDEVISYAALRTIHIHKDQILLNGEAQYLRLVLDQGYYPEGLWTAPSVEALRRDIELAREIGFNGARLHQKVFEPLYFSLADELGFMVFCEFPDWNGGCSNRWEVSDEYQDLLTSEWKRTVKDLHNHPSICCWHHHRGVGGGFQHRYDAETRRRKVEKHRSFVRRVVQQTRQLDLQKRPVHDSSGWIHIDTDLWSFHDYEQREPLFVAEYAGVALDLGGPYGLNPSHLLAGYAGRSKEGQLPTDMEEALKRISGLTQAIYNAEDYTGFCCTQLYDVEYEKNGLVRYDRQRKFPLASLQQIFDGRWQKGRWQGAAP